MTTDDGFVPALRERPDDETLRLVYADWLDEHDDIRGRFLRLENRVHSMAEAGPELQSLKGELSALAARIDVRWLVTACRVHLESNPPFQHSRRIALNVDGPFYTCGDCLACEAPEAEAPELLAPLINGNYTTYFVRQPQTKEEIARACSAINVCCVLDLRYGGTDPINIQLLGNCPEHSDYLIRDDSATLVPASPISPIRPAAQPPRASGG
jgi:uncharacterized protein (TIGR02996 family)